MSRKEDSGRCFRIRLMQTELRHAFLSQYTCPIRELSPLTHTFKEFASFVKQPFTGILAASPALSLMNWECVIESFAPGDNQLRAAFIRGQHQKSNGGD